MNFASFCFPSSTLLAGAFAINPGLDNILSVFSFSTNILDFSFSSLAISSSIFTKSSNGMNISNFDVTIFTAFCGIFSLRNAPVWVQGLSKIFPLTYGANALRSVILRGDDISRLWLNILILSGYVLLFILLNSLALKKYREL